MENIKTTMGEYLLHQEDYDGLCTECGEWTCGGVEPDADGYACYACGAHAVIGAEDAMMGGFIEIVDGEGD